MRQKKLKSVLTLLDVGTAKISCLMVRLMANGSYEVLGMGYAPAVGIKAGAIIDLEKATACIRQALSQVEKQANRQIDKVIVNISSTQLKSIHIQKDIDISGDRAISANDVKKLIDGIIATTLSKGDEVIHAFPISYLVDNEPGILDPRGMHGNTLGVHLHLITMPENQSKNLIALLDSCHVGVEMKVATPYASALATLTDAEKDTGVAVIDLGAGTTSLALFMDGCPVHIEMIPQGGNRLTKDITHGLNTSFEVAERLKTLHGSTFISPRDMIDRLNVPVLEENGLSIQLPQSQLIAIIIPRVEEILENIAGIFDKYPYFVVATKHVVLNGGGASLLGIKEKVSAMLGATARIGKAENLRHMKTSFEPYTFSTCIGLLKYAMINQEKSNMEQFNTTPFYKKGFIGKVMQWLT